MHVSSVAWFGGISIKQAKLQKGSQEKEKEKNCPGMASIHKREQNRSCPIEIVKEALNT